MLFKVPIIVLSNSFKFIIMLKIIPANITTMK